MEKNDVQRVGEGESARKNIFKAEKRDVADSLSPSRFTKKRREGDK